MSDSFPATMSMNDACMEVKGKWVTKGKEVVSDIQDKFNLQEINGWTKKDFMTWVRGFLKATTLRIKESNPDREADMKAGATQLVKLITSKFDEFQIFAGEKMDYEANLCFAYQKEQEDEGPTFLFFKDGLNEKKY